MRTISAILTDCVKVPRKNSQLPRQRKFNKFALTSLSHLLHISALNLYKDHHHSIHATKLRFQGQAGMFPSDPKLMEHLTCKASWKPLNPTPALKGHLGLPMNSGFKQAFIISHYIFFSLENSTWFSYFINNVLLTSCSEYTAFPSSPWQRSPSEMIIPWTTFSRLPPWCLFLTFALGN